MILEREVQGAKRELLDAHKAFQAQQSSGGNEQVSHAYYLYSFVWEQQYL